MFISRALVVISFVLYAHVLATPHIARPLHHRGISARLVAPIAEVQPAQPRRLSKRCKPRPSISQSSTSVPASSKEQPTPASTPHTTYTPPPPPPTTTHAHTTAAPPPPPTTTSHTPPPPATTASSGSGGSGGNEPSFMFGTQTGEGTFYATGLGACGITNNDSQYIAAVSYLLFDNFPGYAGINPNLNPVCGRQVKVTYQGKTVTVTITDRCTGCALTSLDFSPAAFDELADPSVGRLYGIEWEWV